MATDTKNAIRKKVRPMTPAEIKAEKKVDKAFMSHQPKKKK